MSDPMLLVDGEFEYELPRSRITDETPSRKAVELSYEFTDYNARVHMGKGPTRVVVSGFATTSQRESLTVAAMADTYYTFYYPSETGGSLDRYYQRVDVVSIAFATIQPDYHAYTIELSALDGHAYDADTDLAVT